MALNRSGTKVCNKLCKNDILRLMWEKQKELDDRIHKNNQLTRRETRLARYQALFVELAEVLREDEVFKYWKKNRKVLEDEVQLEKVRDEMIDVLHFYISLAQDVFETPSQLYEYYVTKNEVNHDRQDNNY